MENEGGTCSNVLNARLELKLDASSANRLDEFTELNVQFTPKSKHTCIDIYPSG